ncbi:MAG: cytochrome c3 family protein [Desulfobacterales bacterium]
MKKMALFIGIACLFVLIGCGQEEKAEQPGQKETREAAESAKETPGQTVEGVKQKAEETAASAEEKTKEVVEGAKKKTEDTVKAGKEKAEETGEAAKKKTRETFAEAKQETTEAVESAKKQAEEALPEGFPGMITMKNEKAFEEHRMGIVEFDHEKHAASKPEGYGLGCGDCHHDENGEPLTDLKRGDPVQSCYECHDKDGRPRRDPAMSQEEWKKEELTYYYGAIHENCMGCHKQMDAGPVSCTECHPRPQQ